MKIFTLMMFISYGGYKFKLKKYSTLKFYLLRNYLRLKNVMTRISESYHSEENIEIFPIQNKAIRLWRLLLKDKESQISCSLIDKIRQIEREELVLTLSPLNQVEYQLTIMDVTTSKSCLYEIPIAGKLSEAIIELFDQENEKRMILGRTEKRRSIHNDLDKLISRQEFHLKNK